MGSNPTYPAIINWSLSNINEERIIFRMKKIMDVVAAITAYLTMSKGFGPKTITPVIFALKNVKLSGDITKADQEIVALFNFAIQWVEAKVAEGMKAAYFAAGGRPNHMTDSYFVKMATSAVARNNVLRGKVFHACFASVTYYNFVLSGNHEGFDVVTEEKNPDAKRGDIDTTIYAPNNTIHVAETKTSTNSAWKQAVYDHEPFDKHYMVTLGEANYDLSLKKIAKMMANNQQPVSAQNPSQSRKGVWSIAKMLQTIIEESQRENIPKTAKV